MSKYGELIKNFQWCINPETGDIETSFYFQMPDCIAEEDQAEFLAFMKQEMANGLKQYYKDKLDEETKLVLYGDPSADKPRGILNA